MTEPLPMGHEAIRPVEAHDSPANITARGELTYTLGDQMELHRRLAAAVLDGTDSAPYLPDDAA